ncbi:MAG: HDIG domain-containing protein [Verrucomicrobia bacterium]|nr:HDIG domain-containing protein [Verrucomicrobiota bacterium]
MQEQQIDSGRSVRRKERWERLLGGSYVTRRLLLAFSFLILLTWFLHFREVRMEVLEIGTLAPRYVISQTDFDFLDEEATGTLKQEAVRDIGAIYKIDESQIRRYRHDLENSLIEHQKWRSQLPRSTFEEVYTILDRTEEALTQVRFTDERTLRKMEALEIPTSTFIHLEIPTSQSAQAYVPASFWQRAKEQMERGGEFHEESIDYLIASFQKQKWSLQEDFSLERSVRQQVQKEISDRFTHVAAGEQIVKRGEKVTARHIAMVRAMKNALAEARNLWTPLTLIGSILLSFCLVLVSIVYLRHFQKELLASLSKLTLLITILVFCLLFSKTAEYLLLYEGKNLIELVRFPLLIPLASLLICVLIGAEVAMIGSFFLIVVMSVTLAIDYIPFLLINFFAAIVTVFLARRLHKRKEVFAVYGKVWLLVIPVIVAFNLIENSLWSVNFITDLLSSFAFMVVTSLLAIGLLPLFEALFHVMTDMTLMEYMDPDHELMRRLSLEAPGTYQHCMVVSNLAETAARAIGANGLFCRVATLYHDIGKLFNPHYFTENQLGGFNIHQLLTPMESTQVIMAHVPEGEVLARKYHLPQTFIDIIREHHGTTLVYYFYRKQVDLMEGDATKVNEKAFRYPGPKPQTKESAIIMIADTIEAASRSMEEVSEEGLTAVVDQLVAEKAEDGQFDQCQLSFEDLGQVKRSIVKALMVARHLRIKYPQRS